jgi:hypothetical protein
MFKGRVITFYYNNLSSKGYGFKNIILKTKIHFETKKKPLIIFIEMKSNNVFENYYK